MKSSEWQEKGRVLSFVEFRMNSKGLDGPHHMALVEIEDDGPKIICWTTDILKDDEEVVVVESDGRYTCSQVSGPKDQSSKRD